MEKKFWHEKWEKNDIGFHQTQVHPDLKAFYSIFGKVTAVFVPLCGKSADMIWLREQGLEVIGCELDERAVRDFFQENELEFTVENVSDDHQLYRAKDIKIYQGDFFTLELQEKFDLVYDRAAMVALPAEMRSLYAQKLAMLMQKNAANALLIVLEYDQSQKKLPPFSVELDELKRHFNSFEITCLKDSGPIKGFFSQYPQIEASHKLYRLAPKK